MGHVILSAAVSLIKHDFSDTCAYSYQLFHEMIQYLSVVMNNQTQKRSVYLFLVYGHIKQVDLISIFLVQKLMVGRTINSFFQTYIVKMYFKWTI